MNELGGNLVLSVSHMFDVVDDWQLVHVELFERICI